MPKQTVNTGAAQEISLTHSGRTASQVVIQNLGSGIVYIDTVSTVDASTGYKIAAGASTPALDLRGQKLYAMASADGQDVRILLVG